MNSLPQYGAYTFLPYHPTTASPPDPPFKITHTSTWTYCGPLLSPLDLPRSLHTWSTATVSSPPALLQRLLPLLTFLHGFLDQAGVQHYWLTLRATTPTKEYDVPRWHVDDDFFSPLSSRPVSEAEGTKSLKTRGGKQRARAGWKLCTTLLGPSTLFLREVENDTALAKLRETKKKESAKHEHVCSSIRCVGCFDTGEAVRASLAIALADEETVYARYGEVAFFRVGVEEGAVHSEPKCDVDRVFVNVVPGTEEDLRKLMKRFGMGFPRSWSLGLPATVGAEKREERSEGQTP